MVVFKDGAASFTSDSLKALVEAPSRDKVTGEVSWLHMKIHFNSSFSLGLWILSGTTVGIFPPHFHLAGSKSVSQLI